MSKEIYVISLKKESLNKIKNRICQIKDNLIFDVEKAKQKANDQLSKIDELVEIEMVKK